MAKECDMLLVSGGDGTLSEVVTGLMCCEKRPDNVFCHPGTTNDFARTLGLTEKSGAASEADFNRTAYADRCRIFRRGLFYLYRIFRRVHRSEL